MLTEDLKLYIYVGMGHEAGEGVLIKEKEVLSGRWRNKGEKQDICDMKVEWTSWGKKKDIGRRRGGEWTNAN